ncbi:MAG TPA: queuosine precursor transporter [Dehalococcoidia bacterium]
MPVRYSGYFLLICNLFVACLIAANVIAVKPMELAGRVLPAGVIVFPVSYIIGDVLTEVYGYARARLVIWIGFLANLLFVAAAVAGGLVPAAGFWADQGAYDAILGYTPRLLAASFAAYLVGEFANAFVLARMKVATGGRFLWARTIGSTVVGQGLDSAVFILIAFAGTQPGSVLWESVLNVWVFKTGYEVLATPLTYTVVNRLKKLEGVDAFDTATDFNPLPFVTAGGRR